MLSNEHGTIFGPFYVALEFYEKCLAKFKGWFLWQQPKFSRSNEAKKQMLFWVFIYIVKYFKQQLLICIPIPQHGYHSPNICPSSSNIGCQYNAKCVCNAFF